MHEMSIAVNIIELCEQELKKVNAKKIEKLNLIVGKLSGIVVESLQFALEASRQHSALSDATIIIEETPASMKCLKCGTEFESDDYYVQCPTCGEFRHEILGGKELLVKSLTVV
jgi:hydrogenase nickel incorporation protein HypA/HybF